MEKTAELTGLFAAQAILSVSQGETLAPLLGVEKPDGVRMLRQLAVGKREELIAVGQRWLSTNPEDVAHGVLIYDGYITLEGERTDALILEAHTYGTQQSSFGMAIPYRPAGDPEGFTVFTPKFIAFEDIGEKFQVLVEAFFRGVDQHERGSKVWNAASDRAEAKESEAGHPVEREAVMS